MTDKAVVQNSEMKDILSRIQSTTKLRGVTLVAFFLAIVLLSWFNIFPYTGYAWLTISVIGFWIFTVFIFQLIIKKLKTVSAITNFYFYYSSIVELGAITIGVFLNGGIMWIGAILFTFTIIYSNIFLPKIKGHIVSIIACIWFGSAASLQYFKIIPFFPFAEYQDALY